MSQDVMGVTMYLVEEVADSLGVKEYTVREYIRSGKLKASKIGKRWLIAEGDFQNFLKQRGLVPEQTAKEEEEERQAEIHRVVQKISKFLQNIEQDGPDSVDNDRLGYHYYLFGKLVFELGKKPGSMPVSIANSRWRLVIE